MWWQRRWYIVQSMFPSDLFSESAGVDGFQVIKHPSLPKVQDWLWALPATETSPLLSEKPSIKLKSYCRRHLLWIFQFVNWGIELHLDSEYQNLPGGREGGREKTAQLFSPASIKYETQTRCASVWTIFYFTYLSLLLRIPSLTPPPPPN